MAERKSIIFYLDMLEQWNMLTDEQAGVLIKALLRYGSTGERLESSDGALVMAFSFMAAQIDRDGEKWEQKCKRNAEYYQKKKKTNSANSENSVQFSTIQKIQSDSASDNNTDTDNVTDTDTDNVTDTDTDNVTDTDTDTDTEINNTINGIINSKSNNNSNNNTVVTSVTSPDPESAEKRFKKPTVEEVRAYCAEKGYNVDAEHFVNYYESNGWKVGRNPMKKWKAAVATWAKNGYSGSSGRSWQQPATRQRPTYDPNDPMNEGMI